MLTVGSLFSGIGGLDLGLERAGMKVIWQSEIDPFACKVLKKHWPEVVNHGDIKEINWQQVERTDVICGGYPCQPFSTAGKRRGEEDPRHLWPWVRNAISELRPQYAILENVRGHLSLGGTTVIGELADIGYDAEWRVVSAASVGANHKRDRVIIVAYPNSIYSPDGSQCADVPGQDSGWRNDGRGSRGDSWQIGVGSARQDSSNVAYANSSGVEGQRPEQQAAGACGSSEKMANANSRRGPQCVFDNIAIQQLAESSGCIAGHWETEPDVGRVAHGIPNRVDRLRGLGNAVVPQVAEVIGRLVMAHAGY